MNSAHARALRLAIVCALLLATSPVRADSRTDYILNCRGCHGPDGAGTHAVPNFRAELAKFLWVPGGREYLVRVPGTAQSELDDARLAALLNWMLREFSPKQIPTDFSPYTASEIAHLRRLPFADVETVRRQLLQLIAARE